MVRSDHDQRLVEDVDGPQAIQHLAEQLVGGGQLEQVTLPRDRGGIAAHPVGTGESVRHRREGRVILAGRGVVPGEMRQEQVQEVERRLPGRAE